ncbi:putative fatty acid desaturase protein [Botrytis fragariae]|uniref:Delta 8-(E)-sphingolipid desaturase n=1 Tax=Botrytis fragariae TaxID=1964551 RepID=A0A8H6EKI7_9HELO|nr:putative fatty acid desaturase protein [Botrytis fragariae]KAF5875250.1 putative fatty acid desaturase protein [Botrytis fragariae]
MTSQIRIISRPEIAHLISHGHKIFILDGSVIKADAWLPFHPGGEKSIMHMIGRDATDEINALHSEGARERMRKYVIGRIEGRWENLVPPIQGGMYRAGVVQEAGERDEVLDRGEESRFPGDGIPGLLGCDGGGGGKGDSLRLRCIGAEMQSSRAPSSSFSSSLSLMKMELEKEKENPHLTSLEALTAHSISTDLSKYPLLTPNPKMRLSSNIASSIKTSFRRSL